MTKILKNDILFLIFPQLEGIRGPNPVTIRGPNLVKSQEHSQGIKDYMSKILKSDILFLTYPQLEDIRGPNPVTLRGPNLVLKSHDLSQGYRGL